MKNLLVTITLFGSLNLFAGGDAPLPCLPIEKATVRLKSGSVLDRGNNSVNYIIVMDATRCKRGETITTNKYLFIHYDAPALRQENDGLLIGESFDWDGVENNIFPIFKHSFDVEKVTEDGIKIQIGTASDVDNSSLDSVPQGFIGSNTVLRIYGNAFPTHSISGPFTE
jgi:hypothetical protein